MKYLLQIYKRKEGELKLIKEVTGAYLDIIEIYADEYSRSTDLFFQLRAVKNG